MGNGGWKIVKDDNERKEIKDSKQEEKVKDALAKTVKNDKKKKGKGW